jgi:hypothetical protein
MFENRDATEVIHAFHSDAAHTMLKRLPKLPVRPLPRGHESMPARARAHASPFPPLIFALIPRFCAALSLPRRRRRGWRFPT